MFVWIKRGFLSLAILGLSFTGVVQAQNGPPVTWVPAARVPGVPPFLIHFGDGPSYALVREEKEAEGGSRLFHTSDRSLVEYLAFRLQTELSASGPADEDTQRLEVDWAESVERP